MTKPKSPSTREILAVLRTQAELCEEDLLGVPEAARLIRKHRAACFRAAMQRISGRKMDKNNS